MKRSFVFFCHPQSPHEKGSVENRNKAVRRYIKKRSDLSSYPKEVFALVENKLRDKYMKCLQYKTPREAFVAEMQKINTKKSTSCGILKRELLLTESVRIAASTRKYSKLWVVCQVYFF